MIFMFGSYTPSPRSPLWLIFLRYLKENLPLLLQPLYGTLLKSFEVRRYGYFRVRRFCLEE